MALYIGGPVYITCVIFYICKKYRVYIHYILTDPLNRTFNRPVPLMENVEKDEPLHLFSKG